LDFGLEMIKQSYYRLGDNLGRFKIAQSNIYFEVLCSLQNTHSEMYFEFENGYRIHNLEYIF